MITCCNAFNVWPKTTLLLPAWHRDAKSLDTPLQHTRSSTVSGHLVFLLLLSEIPEHLQSSSPGFPQLCKYPLSETYPGLSCNNCKPPTFPIPPPLPCFSSYYILSCHISSVGFYLLVPPLEFIYLFSI